VSELISLHRLGEFLGALAVDRSRICALRVHLFLHRARQFIRKERLTQKQRDQNG
jgi:hypothetical protein